MGESIEETKGSDLRAAIRRTYLADEAQAVDEMTAALDLDDATRLRIAASAADLVTKLRAARQPGMMETFLAEYGLTTREGVALMCLAEALLRVPDAPTIDALIQDKIAPADWSRHLGRSASPLVNASTWALMLTGKVISADEAAEWDVLGTVRSLVRQAGEPVIRKAVARAMRIMGHQFVLGRDIGEALERAKEFESRGYTYSYDMLGEAAHTAADAQRYFLAYSGAISALAGHTAGSDVRANPGISVKLSALHPRYEFTKQARVMDELVPRLSSLVHLAKNANMGFNIDAEEADRLELSLDIIEAVLSSPDLKGWDGFGVVVQAYMPRAPLVIDWLYELASRLDRRIMVRLVKGAYWDAEIKRAQVDGFERYPVFTRKVSTDICYLACVRRLLRMTDRIYPQFASHNAHSVAAVLELAGDAEDYEFQRLHGMGEQLYDIVREDSGAHCRIYAPVGVHADLLAYLVRRLLENGANSSFVNQLLDDKLPPESIVRDPVAIAADLPAIANPRIPLPADMYGAERRNAKGWNLADPDCLAALQAERDGFRTHRWQAAPLVAGVAQPGATRPVVNPADHEDLVGQVVEAGPEQVAAAIDHALAAAPAWRDRPPADRAACLDRIADLYERHAAELMAACAREAGKTLNDGIAEIREAVDFCRYYAQQAKTVLENENRSGLGVFVCISPWNFPLAIFTGQIVAALVAGNAVIAKPAEQTPLVAARAVALMHEAGIPAEVLQLLPGDGPTVGGPLVADPRIAGVCFTGSTETAQLINRAMANGGNSNAPLIAETGGLNAMIVDSSALAEQAVGDIIASAFQSAGQRCSALRVLYLQEDVAERVTEMLAGAMAELAVGNPWDLATDVGPVIDAEAQAQIQAHCDRMAAEGRLIARVDPEIQADHATFVSPSAFRVDGIGSLEREIFGPVLHVATYRASELDQVVAAINGSGYGLTLGIHTRIDRRVQRIAEQARVGNTYVNRNQIGAVVGVQPFGGEGLSGTGPKAGGPHYLYRFTRGPDAPVEDRAWTGRDDGTRIAKAVSEVAAEAEAWSGRSDRRAVLSGAGADRAAVAGVPDLGPDPSDLPGPTGESNRLAVHGRGVFLCLGDTAADLALTALLAGNGVVVAATGTAAAAARTLADKSALPLRVVEVDPSAEAITGLVGIAGVATDHGIPAIRRALAARSGPILPLATSASHWCLYLAERSLCIDTTASGGNAALLADAGRPDEAA